MLRGLGVGVGDGDVVVNCASSHLTLFTISDESETAKWWSRRCRRWRTVWWHKTTWTYGWPPRITGEYKVVLRQRMGFGEGVKLAVLNVITTNSFVGLMFSCDHEAIVFGRPDMTLFGAVLMTLLSSSLLFDPTSFGTADDVWLALLNVFVSAVLTNVLLLPVQHTLPFMVSNVNSVSTSTKVPMTILKREMERL